jgi:3-oxoacyl-[acyl-carrier protein] reductase
VLGPEIRVLTVSPAAVDTAFVPGRATAMVEKAASTAPSKRLVQADEGAQAVLAAVVNLTSTAGWTFPWTAASWPVEVGPKGLDNA